jgi:translation initiation factor IF-3
VRLIGADGEQIGVVTLSEALKRAQDEGYDLAEISPNADPPVAKLLDWGKFQYEQAKSVAKQRKSSRAGEVKGIRLGLKTGEHDLEIKARRALGFLEDGNKVRVALRLRGRENDRPELGRGVVQKFVGMLGDQVKLESQPALQGREISAILIYQKPKGGKANAQDEDAQRSEEALPDHQDRQGQGETRE